MSLGLASCDTPSKSTVAKEGRLLEKDGIVMVELFGDWHEMGAQYGRLAKPYLEDVLAFIDRNLAPSPEATAEDDISNVRATTTDASQPSAAEKASDIADKLFANYPDYLKDFFDGASASSGISLDRLKLCNAVEYIEGCFFCSAMAVWGDWSEGGLVFGRNYDAASYAEIDKDVIVTVYHPDNGLAAATIGYAGEIYCVNGLNEKGIFIELNNGMPSAGSDIHWEICPSTSELFDLLFKAEDLDDVDNFFETTRSAASFLIGVADSCEARVYEWCYDGVKRSDAVTPDGLMVSTNHYAHPEWEYPTPADADSWNSLSRRANMLSRADENKGKIDVGAMEAIMSTSIEDGGPYHHLTRYQLVVVPSDMTISINLSCYGRWVDLDLKNVLTDRKSNK